MTNTAQKQEQAHTPGPKQTFEMYLELAKHIERLANAQGHSSLLEWHKFLDALNEALSAAPETARERDAWRKRAEDEHAKALENHSQTIKAEAQRDEFLGAAKVALVCIETLMEGTAYTEQSFAAPSMLRDAIAGVAS